MLLMFVAFTLVVVVAPYLIVVVIVEKGRNKIRSNDNNKSKSNKH